MRLTESCSAESEEQEAGGVTDTRHPVSPISRVTCLQESGREGCTKAPNPGLVKSMHPVRPGCACLASTLCVEECDGRQAHLRGPLSRQAVPVLPQHCV